FLPVSRSETTTVAEGLSGLSPRSEAKNTIQRRGATAERSNGKWHSTVPPRRIIAMLPIRGLKPTATITASLREASAEIHLCPLRVKSQGILTLLFALMSRDPFGCGLG